MSALASAGLLAFVSACAAVHRPATTVAQLQRDADEGRVSEQRLRDSVVARLVRRVVRRGDKTLDVLMLSGGGQNGSYGAGFLRGWRSRADSSWPTFDLVTGISTGALKAPYALVGSVAAIDTLSALYLAAADRVAPSIDWWSPFRRTGGLVNTKRYDNTLTQSFNGPFRQALQAAFADDRQIVFGTTDMDIGTGRTWAMSEQLDSTATSLRRTQQLLKAATAIPGIFPSVVIDGHVHADGGVTTNVLPLLTLSDYRALNEALAARGITGVTVRVYVVMNMWAHAEPKIITPASRKQISARTNMMLFYAHQPQTLELIDALAHASTAAGVGMRVEAKMVLLPSATALMPGADKLFDRRFMAMLDSMGFAKARHPQMWDSVPSAYARPPLN
ncbi:MAG: patatin-like phospholipase family protein [Gemmatimonadaceae bacterium]|nr:patatin-like phospholipase family protein [Gemmatimonadaceae bacterium]